MLRSRNAKAEEREKERHSRGLAARSAESMSGLHERKAGRKEVSKSVGRKKRSFVGQSEERERKENGKESGERTRAGAGQRRVGREKG